MQKDRIIASMFPHFVENTKSITEASRQQSEHKITVFLFDNKIL